MSKSTTTRRLALAARPAAFTAGVFLAGVALVATVVPGNAATGQPRSDVTTAVTVRPTTPRPTGTATTPTSRPTTAIPTPTGPSASPPNFPVWPAPPPTLRSPANDANTPLSDITFVWSMVPGATAYDIEVSTSNRFTKASQIFLQRTTSWQFTPLSEFKPGEYWWRVRGVSKTGVSGWSVVWQFRQAWLDGGTVARPSITSTNGSFPINQTQLSWTPVSGASQYEVQFSRTGVFRETDIAFTCATAHTTLTPYGAGAVTYKGLSGGDPCNIYGVALGDVPGVPGTPTATASPGQIVLRWTAPTSGGGGVTSYVIQQSTTNGASWVSAVPDTATDTTVTITSCVTTGLSVVFRVAAINPAGQGRFSAASAAVTPQAAVTPTTSGTAAPTAAPSPSSTTTCPTGTGSGSGTGEAFRINETVFWRVRAIDNRVSPVEDGPQPDSIFSVWSDQATSAGATPPGPGSFRVQTPTSGSPAAPVAVAPTAPTGNEVFSDAPVLSWAPVTNPASGGINYKVVIATDRDFTNRITEPEFTTQNTSLIPSQVLVDNNTESYYWFVLACTVSSDGTESCPPDRDAINQAGKYGIFRKIGPQATVPTGQPKTQKANVTMTWDPVSAATGATASYLLQVSQDRLFEPEITGMPIVEEVSTDNTAYTVVDSSIYPDGIYYWRVAAVDAAGQALPWSAVQSFKKLTTTPPPPNFLTLTAGKKSFRASWSPPSTDNGSTITSFRLSWRKTSKNTWKRSWSDRASAPSR